MIFLFENKYQSVAYSEVIELWSYFIYLFILIRVVGGCFTGRCNL